MTLELVDGALGRAALERWADELDARAEEIAAADAVVTASADLAATASALVEGMTKLNGQWCEAPRRLFADPAVHDDLAAALREALAQVTVGSWRDDVDVGPLAHRGHLARVREQVARLGVAAPANGGGFRFAPLLIPGAATEEIFGPVLTLQATDDPVRDANALGDGLAGEVRLGGTQLIDLVDDSAQSFWGTSGIGGHGGREVLEAFRGTRTVGEDDPALAV